MEKKKKRKRERERGRDSRQRPDAHAPAGRDARDEGEQGDGTAVGFGCRDQFFGRSGDRAENGFKKSELNDANYFQRCDLTWRIFQGVTGTNLTLGGKLRDQDAYFAFQE